MPQQPVTVLAKVSPDDVVTRLLSFDRNRDGKVAKAELAERMHSVVTRGDADGDGALDRREIRTLAMKPAATAATATGGRGIPFPGGYGFGDQNGLSSRSHIDGGSSTACNGRRRRSFSGRWRTC
jgi:hypothetical protein